MRIHKPLGALAALLSAGAMGSTAIPDLPYRHVTGGDSFTCAIDSSAKLWCWGAGDHGKLGRNTTADAIHPSAVSPAQSFKHVDAGDNHACAIDTNDLAWCWGKGTFGQLGDGSYSDRAVPTQVTNLGPVSWVSAGGNHSCAVDMSNDVYCWGRNDSGQLGNGSTSLKTPWPVKATNLAGVYRVMAGGAHTATYGQTGYYTWGSNTRGQLGQGDTQNRSIPTRVSSHTSDELQLDFGRYGEVVFPEYSLAAGDQHTCYGATSQDTICFGANDYGQLASGDFVDRISPTWRPGREAGRYRRYYFGLNEFIAAGQSHTLFGDGELGWRMLSAGDNTSGQAALESDIDQSAWMNDSKLNNYMTHMVASGKNHACAILSYGDVDLDAPESWHLFCWGTGTRGELGTGFVLAGTQSESLYPSHTRLGVDSDRDGVADFKDHAPEDPSVSYLDTDGDGVADPNDNCVNDANPNQDDLDNDRAGDVCDDDRDGDGYPNGSDAFPDDRTEHTDTDGDGVGDNRDNCVDAANADQTDKDGDGKGKACDSDDNGNGIDDSLEDIVWDLLKPDVHPG